MIGDGVRLRREQPQRPAEQRRPTAAVHAEHVGKLVATEKADHLGGEAVEDRPRRAVLHRLDQRLRHRPPSADGAHWRRVIAAQSLRS
jgi:hypothetical protein